MKYKLLRATLEQQAIYTSSHFALLLLPTASERLKLCKSFMLMYFKD